MITETFQASRGVLALPVYEFKGTGPRYDAPEGKGPLSGEEADALRRCEAVLAKHRDSFEAACDALLEIRDRRLYRATHRRFEDYTREKYNFGAAYGRRLAVAGQVQRSIKDAPGAEVIDNEGKARELARLGAGQRREVVKRLATAAREKGAAAVTAKDVRRVAALVTEKPKTTFSPGLELTAKDTARLALIKLRDVFIELGGSTAQGPPFGQAVYHLGCAESELNRIMKSGQFVIQRRDAAGNGGSSYRYLTGSGGWTNRRTAARCFEDSASAATALRGRVGKVVPL